MFFLRPSGMEFSYRGNAGGVDLVTTSIFKDAAYHEWDMSGIIPAGTKLVLLKLWRIRSTATDNTAQFRPKGGEDLYNTAHWTCPLGNEYFYPDILVVPDADGIIEYKFSASFNYCEFLVRGWFK